MPTWVHTDMSRAGKLQYEILPVKEHNDYENLSGEAGKRIQSVWKETTDMLGLEVFKSGILNKKSPFYGFLFAQCFCR